MNSTVKKFKTIIIESRLFSVIAIVIVLLMRYLMFNQLGVIEYKSVNSSYLWEVIAPFFADPWTSFILSTICVFIIAIILSQLNVKYGLIRGRSNFPLVIPLILFSLHPFTLSISPDLLATIFILWAMMPLTNSYQSSRPQKYSFQASVLISIAGVFQVYALMFILLWWIGQRMMNAITARSFFSSLLGVILVYIFVFSLFVFGDNISGFLLPFYSFGNIDFGNYWFLTVPQWGFIVLLLIMIISHIVIDFKHFFRDKVLTQKIITFSIVLIIFSIIVQIAYFDHSLLWLQVILSLLSLIISHYYSTTTDKWGVYFFFIILVILTSYFCIKCYTNLSPF